MPTLAWVGLTVVSVVCVDQASKAMLLRRLILNRSVRISRGVRLRHVVNVGSVSGIRSPTGLLLLWGVAVSSSLLILELGGWFGEGAVDAGVAVALGGATGNLLDRLWRGHIVDFIEIGFWPIFNVADVGIVAGLGLTLAPLLL
jgi:signal peptidase II